jgi:hypothetical protein
MKIDKIELIKFRWYYEKIYLMQIPMIAWPFDQIHNLSKVIGHQINVLHLN